MTGRIGKAFSLSRPCWQPSVYWPMLCSSQLSAQEKVGFC